MQNIYKNIIISNFLMRLIFDMVDVILNQITELGTKSTNTNVEDLH